MVQSTLENEGFELVDLVVRGKNSSRVLQFFVDHERGITLDDCVHLNRKLSNLLDSEAEQIELGSYSLEVSSPGLDRPLKTEKDFQRNIGRTVSLMFFKN
ncbi:MAG: ribosome maturation factor RimP, partial [Candidatus Hodarchaeota archaeon]